MKSIFLFLLLSISVYGQVTYKPGVELRFQNTNKTFYTGIKGHPGTVGNYVLRLPGTLGTSGQALLTDGANNLYWGAGGGGGGGGVGDAILAGDNTFSGANIFGTLSNQFTTQTNFNALSSAVPIVTTTDGQESIRLVTNNTYNALRVGTVSATGNPLISLTTGAAANGSTSGTEAMGFSFVGSSTPTYGRITAGTGPTNIITWVTGVDALQYNVGIGQAIIHPQTRLQVFGDTSIGGLSSVATLRFYEASGNGTNYVGLKPPSLIGALNPVWTLPSADGTAGQFMKTDGAGNLSFSSDGSALTSLPASQVTGTFSSITTSGSITRNGIQILTPNALGAFSIDVTQGNNTKTIADGSDGTDTFTFSATPSSGALFGLELTNADLDTDDVITIPSSWSQNAGATITTFTLKRGGKLELVWKKTASGYSIFGDPVDVTGVDGGLTTDETASGNQVVGLVNSGGVSQWDAVYINGSGQLVKADADGASTFPVRGLAASTQSTGVATAFVNQGVIRHTAWTWTPGGTIYLSTAAGGLTQTAPSGSGNTVQAIGVALTADNILLNISADYGTAP